jgi:hypothetical protein
MTAHMPPSLRGADIPATLAVTLDVGVPLEIARLRDATPEQFERLRAETVETLTLASASIEMRNGKSATQASALIRALALMAYAEGGVRAFGRHWCTDHRVCIEAGAA